jgi:glutaminyl-peptide cyclotransferase
MKPLHAGLALLLMYAGCARENAKPVAEQPQQTESHAIASMTIPTFDGTRAYDYLLAQTKFGPRNPGSAGYNACREYLITELRKYSPLVRVQRFTHPGYGGETLQLANIIASTDPQALNPILLCAHWDTRPRADQDENKARRNEPIIGANDGASGVAVLLQLAAMFKEHPPRVPVDLVLFDGEDYGKEGDLDNYLLGAKYFAANKRPDYVPRFAILLDMIGDKFLEIPKEQHSVRYAPDVVNLVWNTARQLGYPQFIDEPGELVTDDHLPLNDAGIKAIDLIDFNYPDQTNRFWHTHQDIPENCSSESLEAVGSVLTHVVYSQMP